jgi:hypothetical protein
MMAPAQILETTNLLETSAGALIAGVGVPTAVSLAIRGYIRAPELWREGDHLRGSFYGAVGAASLALTLAIIVLGLKIVAGGSA